MCFKADKGLLNIKATIDTANWLKSRTGCCLMNIKMNIKKNKKTLQLKREN